MSPSIIKGRNVRVEPAGASGATAPRADAPACAPRRAADVRVLAEDGVVYGLEIVCACGETTVVELEVAAPAPVPAPAAAEAPPESPEPPPESPS